ncbi:sensor histidine kinase [Azospirillum thermophilum]|uniref:sensor histidine kinase n=1 Tax=Azospirillum thermophilum TaxID=2202148 RepID=UPI001FE95796|nr:histidine kinase dimerization/phosphoacceptor domain -containing protein [Azospirillum thermophilum]
MAEDLPEVQSYWITDAAGIIRATSQEWPARALNVADREYFRVHAQGRKDIHIGPRLLGRIRQSEVFFTVSHRMEWPDGSFQGVAQVSILPSYFSAFYRSALARPGDVILLLREDGSVLAREPASGAAGDAVVADIGRHPELIAAPETDGIFRTVTAFDGVERLMVRRKVPDLPVYVVYGIDTATLTDEWRSRVAPYAYFAGPVAVLLLVMGIIALRRSREVALAQQQLRQANDELEQRIAERTRHLDRALADKEVLLRDIHHRVKNNLQVILSLLQLQSQRLPALKPHFDEALARIHTMGLIHEQIYRTTGVSEIRLDEFVTALCGNLRSFYDRPEQTVRISHDADPVVLDLNRAVPFSLILNEVVSNAYKHGFRDRSEGEIRITVRAEADLIRLTIHDDGIGLPVGQPKSKSMGMDLIRAFARQLGGDHAFSSDGGTRFDLTFPRTEADT